MATTPPESLPAFDARGRALPLPPEEERRRALEAMKALDELLNMGDEEEQRATYQALEAALEETRSAHRKWFAE